MDKVNEHSYDLPPMLYDLRGFCILTLTYNNLLTTQLLFFGRNISENHLECAVGTGTFTKLCLLFSKFKTVTGVDYSKAMLAGAKKKLKRSTVLCEDLRQLSFSDNQFLSANLPNAFHTIGDIELALKEIHRVLKPGAKLAVNVLTPPQGNGILSRIANRVNAWGMRIGILFRPYSKEESLQLLEKHLFKVESHVQKGNSLYIIASCSKPDKIPSSNRS